MRTRFNLQIIFCISLFLLIPITLSAQQVFKQKMDMKNYTDHYLKILKNLPPHSELNQEDNIEQKYQSENLHQPPLPLNFPGKRYRLSDIMHSAINKVQSATDVLDSVVYIEDGTTSKESLNYDSNGNILTKLEQHRDADAGIWVNDWRGTYTYDGNGNLLTSFYEDWDTDAGIWVNDWRGTYTYDGNGNRLTSLSEDWDTDAGIWVNGGRDTYSYDGNGNRLTDIYEYWDKDAGIWVNVWRGTYTYDENGNLLTSFSEDWVTDAGIWVGYWRGTYSYDGNGNRLSRLYQNWDTNERVWVNDWRGTYTYDGNGNLLTSSSENWDTDTGIWINDRRGTYTYDENGNLLTELYEDRDTDAGIWVNDRRGTYTYDGKGNLLTYLSEDWDTNAGIWVNYGRYTDTYDVDEKLTHFLYEEWDGTGWVATETDFWFIYNDYYFYSSSCQEFSAYYGTLTSIHNSNNNMLKNFSLSQNFPNPFNPTTTISYSVAEQTNVKIIVFNSLGKEISLLIEKKQSPGNYKVNFDGSNLSSGVYFYRIITDSFVKTRKMILLR